jgi:TetR/AcrR family transcriptional regulator
VIRFHLEELLEVVEAAGHPNLSPDVRLRELVGTLLEAYKDADSQHNVQISSMRFLSVSRQAELKAMERELVRIFSDAVAGIAPQLKGTKMLKPVTMSLFGMVNWHYLWFKSTGPFTRADYSDLVTKLISDGTRNIRTQPLRATKRAVPAK